MVISLLGGMLASMLFTRLWRALSGAHDAPEATDYAVTWADIVPAAALHGLVIRRGQGVADRAGAKESKRTTGRWPGKRSRVRTSTRAGSSPAAVMINRQFDAGAAHVSYWSDARCARADGFLCRASDRLDAL